MHGITMHFVAFFDSTQYACRQIGTKKRKRKLKIIKIDNTQTMHIILFQNKKEENSKN